MTTTADAALPAPAKTPTIAARAGLTLQPRTKAARAFLAHLKDAEGDGAPNQLQKNTTYIVTALAEQLIDALLSRAAEAVDNANFTYDVVVEAVRTSDRCLGVFASSLPEVAAFVARKKRPAADGPADEEPQHVDDDVDFSCVRHLKELIRAKNPTIKQVKSDAAYAVQFFVDELHVRLYEGAFLVAKQCGRKTVMKDDVLTAFKIAIGRAAWPEVLEHAHAVAARLDELDLERASKKKAEAPTPEASAQTSTEAAPVPPKKAAAPRKKKAASPVA